MGKRSKIKKIKLNDFHKTLIIGALWIFMMMFIMAWSINKQDNQIAKQQVNAIKTSMTALNFNNNKYLHCVNSNINIVYIAWCLENEQKSL
ncbi:hypothetical protein [Piscirickettsia litoralis]|uniref:Uncharacterized protein n=1 Tax=Piscirickettsia litoralis TaxID=1891921 RepID=A0ABX3A109_9GAMM|nr:hypothetical protein [Piscirickettsia litoralis]ODN42138.1 hypothetical protein BGC07_03220 [Piscirickettsia litoralis]